MEIILVKSSIVENDKAVLMISHDNYEMLFSDKPKNEKGQIILDLNDVSKIMEQQQI